MNRETDANRDQNRKLDRLDRALEEAFPGSDPVAVSQPVPGSDDEARKQGH